MKVAVYYSNSKFEIKEIPVPKIQEGEILVKVKSSGICGTDVMEWYRKNKAGSVLGHEIAGEIAETKSDKYKVGDRVFVSHHVPCDECKYCKEGNHTACETLHKGNFDPGGFSEYVRVPKLNVEKGVYVLPSDVSFDEGTMIEPLACSVRGLRKIGVKENHKVLILGSGVSGLLNIMVAKNIGAEVTTTDIDEYRLKKAKEFGADKVVHAKDLNEKADKVILCTGSMHAVKQAFESVDTAGAILLFAIPSENIVLPTVDVWRNELTVTSSYGAAPVDLEESLELIKDKKINVKDLITDIFSLDKIEQGFSLASNPKESLKVVLHP